MKAPYIHHEGTIWTCPAPFCRCMRVIVPGLTGLVFGALVALVLLL